EPLCRIGRRQPGHAAEGGDQWTEEHEEQRWVGQRFDVGPRCPQLGPDLPVEDRAGRGEQAHVVPLLLVAMWSVLLVTKAPPGQREKYIVERGPLHMRATQPKTTCIERADDLGDHGVSLGN